MTVFCLIVPGPGGVAKNSLFPSVTDALMLLRRPLIALITDINLENLERSGKLTTDIENVRKSTKGQENVRKVSLCRESILSRYRGCKCKRCRTLAHVC